MGSPSPFPSFEGARLFRLRELDPRMRRGLLLIKKIRAEGVLRIRAARDWNQEKVSSLALVSDPKWPGLRNKPPGQGCPRKPIPSKGRSQRLPDSRDLSFCSKDLGSLRVRGGSKPQEGNWPSSNGMALQWTWLTWTEMGAEGSMIKDNATLSGADFSCLRAFPPRPAQR